MGGQILARGEPPPDDDDDDDDDGLRQPGREPRMLCQPATQLVSHEQLMIKIKGICAGLAMVEAKHIVVNKP